MTALEPYDNKRERADTNVGQPTGTQLAASKIDHLRDP